MDPDRPARRGIARALGAAAVAIALAWPIAAACSGPNRSRNEWLTTELQPPPPTDIRNACELTALRCTRCHTIDRLVLARVDTPIHWERYVDRMRRMPQSGIAPEEAPVIVRCLVYRSFGPTGLAEHDERGKAP